MLKRILENSTHVPSAGYTQDFDFVVVKDQSTRRKLAEAAFQEEYNEAEVGSESVHDFIASAPIIVVPCANKTSFEKMYGKATEDVARLPWWLIDAGFASFALLLSAFQEGLVASFIGSLDDNKVIEILKLPNDGSIVPLAVIPMGYEHPKAREYETKFRKTWQRRHRKKLEEFLHLEDW